MRLLPFGESEQEGERLARGFVPNKAGLPAGHSVPVTNLSPAGSPCARVASARMWSGLVMSMISGSISGPGLCRRPVAPDTREDVEPPPDQFACRGRTDGVRRTGYNGDRLNSRDAVMTALLSSTSEAKRAATNWPAAQKATIL
jgi:hypothetical protein